MNYLKIDKCSLVDGVGVRVVLYCSGCTLHCEGCHNQCTWSFKSGNTFTKETEEYLLDCLNNSYISGLTLTGGHPLEMKNLKEVKNIIQVVRGKYPNKSIWLYTGHTFEELNKEQREVALMCDVVVDGAYIEKLRDYTLKFRGSSNQRLIDIKATKETGIVTEVIL